MSGFRKYWVALWGAGLLAGTLSHAAPHPGKVIVDWRTGPAVEIPHDAGLVFTIDATVGQRHDQNLFHSFSQFDIGEGETANFTGPAGIEIKNIIARVIGGNSSEIYGTIQSSIPGANFFLINPFGIHFSSGAEINVSGAFTATTADYVKLNDGAGHVGRFDARNPANDVLTFAPVSAFGFLDGNHGAITVESALTGADRSSVSLIGGDISFNGGNITVNSGRINLISLQSLGELGLDVTDLNAPVDTTLFDQLGAITLANSSHLDVSGNRAGQIVINGDSFSMQGGAIDAVNNGAEAGLGIELTVRGSLSLDGMYIDAIAYGAGDGAPVSLKAGSIDLENGATIQTLCSPVDEFSTGNAGNITIQTGVLTLGFGAGISATTATPGNGGNIDITATTVQLGNSAYIVSLTALGTAGDISIHGKAGPADSLTMVSDSFISTTTYGAATGGKISITASTIQIDGKNQGFQTGIFSGTLPDYSPDTGPGGIIDIHAGQLDLRNGAKISTSTQTSGAGGIVDIHAANLTLDTDASIASSASSSGKAGSLTLTVSDTVRMQGHSALSVSADQSAGGDITVNADRAIRLIDSQIDGQAFNDGGNVRLIAPSLIYLLNGTVTAASTAGNGGNVFLDPTLVVLNHSRIAANALLNSGGHIFISSDFFLPSASRLDASGGPAGIQGTILITAPSLDLAGNFVELPDNLIDAGSLLTPHCAIRRPRGASSFTSAGRGALPAVPDGLLPALPQ